MKAVRSHLLLCGGTGCRASGGMTLKDVLEAELEKRGLSDEMKIVVTGCNGFCALGPILVVQPDDVIYVSLKPKDIPELVSEHLIKGRIVKRLLYKHPVTKQEIPTMQQIPFFAQQELRVLRNRGLIDPEKIDEYIGRDGYSALAKALAEMTPDQIIDEVEKSGLRGRGGGGFLAARKWRTTRSAPGAVRYVICNGDEGDPGAFMDRSVMEGDPHSVIEGMIIGAYAIGASKGYIYVRMEYPLAVKNLAKALTDARAYGLLGDDILDSGFSFDIEINRGGGAFICGESSALMQSIMGKAGEPRAKYIHTSEKGLWDMPTNLNNVETWANIPLIINHGSAWFSSIGTKGSTGTKVFSLVGGVNNVGLVEVPMGITLREIIYDIGGGIKGDKKFKAVQTGGPSGGCIPAEHLDTPVDFDELTKLGSMMGSGGMIVMDEDTCMVDVARYFINFLVDESCGKCTPCREGLRHFLTILTRITEGQGQEGDVELLEEIGEGMIWGSLCALGGSAPNPVMSTIKYFRDEYDAHIRDKKCPARVCTKLITFSIDRETCIACGKCKKVCPVNCITGAKKVPHVIDESICIRCRACYEVCPTDAVKIR
jgi:NADH:ubiquinone oxidoreductase subunit F (NADH-binding)/(2Fe-2S) ferredoxin/Pyruvate/2-oxoacid:ferredoxin oxidoreductase delta subunit